MSYEKFSSERRSPSSDEFTEDDKTVHFQAPIPLRRMEDRNFEGPSHAMSGSSKLCTNSLTVLRFKTVAIGGALRFFPSSITQFLYNIQNSVSTTLSLAVFFARAPQAKVYSVRNLFSLEHVEFGTV